MAWLLGRQLIASLKGTLLYTAFGSKLDARDWMHAEEYPDANQERANKVWQGYADKFWTKSDTDYWKSKGEFWFDYISDTGDGMRATYSIAYLCLSRLWLNGSLQNLQQSFTPSPAQQQNSTASPDRVGFMVQPGFAPQEPDQYRNAVLNREQINSRSQTELPRGEFLLVGGDTTYHLSDYEGLHTRFQTPFNWAFEDAKQDGRLWKHEDAKWDDLRRPLFGIPGNHDYYDQLDGFRRQFRRPIKKDMETRRLFDRPQLMLDAFVRCQQASYVALRLPFDWMIWGLDTELGKVDERQRHFFRNIKVKNGLSIEEKETPDKLIVATCAPTTVFGKYADKDDEKSAKAFFQLGLPRPFLDPEDARKQDEEEAPELKKDQCRLDLSGDIHLYARYWGRDSGQNPRKEQAKRGECPQSDYYASVVSGLGGAFHHPSTTYADELREQILYPSVDDSREEVARRIFKPWNIIRGGGVWAIGFLLTFLLYFAATIATSSRQAIDNLPPLVWTRVTKPTFIYSTVSTDGPTEVHRHWLNPWYYVYGETWSPENFYYKIWPLSQRRRFIHFWGKEAAEAPPEYWVGSVLSVASMGLILLASYLAKRIYKIYRKQEEVTRKAMPASAAGAEEAQGTIEAYTKRPADQSYVMDKYDTAIGPIDEKPQSQAWYEKLMEKFILQVWPLVALSALALLGGIFTLQPFKAFLTPFGNSLIMLLTLSWATAAIILCVRYSDWLSRMASKITIKLRHWLLVWFLAIVAALGVLCGFFIYGHNNTASDTLVDILLTLVVAAVLVGLTLLGIYKVGEVTDGPLGKAYGALGFVLGLFHALLQLGVPFLLVRKGTAVTWIMAAVLILIMQLIGWWLMKGNYHKLLLGTWLIFGSAMLLLPFIAFYLFDGSHAALWIPFLDSFRDRSGYGFFSPEESSLQWKLLACFIAGCVGLLMSCIWLNWYLAVALLYHGHNNETGGAARIEKFKQFIRFRLTENDLTGFVIAVREPRKCGTDLYPKLIDVIYLTRKP